jgi:hypothetical protein
MRSEGAHLRRSSDGQGRKVEIFESTQTLPALFAALLNFSGAVHFFRKRRLPQNRKLKIASRKSQVAYLCPNFSL